MPQKKTLILPLALVLGFGFLTAGGSFAATKKDKVLYSFCPTSCGTDGDYTIGGLIFDASGNLYGTDYAGGTHDQGPHARLSSGSL